MNIDTIQRSIDSDLGVHNELRSSSHLNLNSSNFKQVMFTENESSSNFFKVLETDTDQVKMNKFFKYVYNSHCQCNTECIKIPGFMSTADSSDCKRIIIDEKIENYKTSIENIINLFKEQNIITFRTTKYYVNTHSGKPVKLSWDNIKTRVLPKNQMKLWLFRKAIVDCIIKDILTGIKDETTMHNVDTNIKVYSVGSSKLSSDYDITVYSKPRITFLIITKFQEIFKHFFTIDSSTVFDTNIYGKGFITFIKDNIDKDLYTEYKCKSDIIYYIKDDNV